MKSFKHSTVTGVGDTGLSSVSADHQVKPCDSKEDVTVEVTIAPEFDPTDEYRITITVRDAATGATVGSASALEIAHRPTGA